MPLTMSLGGLNGNPCQDNDFSGTLHIIAELGLLVLRCTSSMTYGMMVQLKLSHKP